MTAIFGTRALAVRTLRTDARSQLLHGLRIGLAGVLLCALIGVQMSGAAFGAPGRRLFQAILEIDFWFVSVLGTAVFASLVAEDREQGGLELMRCAGLGALPIVLGKSIGQLVTALSLLAVQLPFALLAVALGGIDTSQVLAGFAVLGGYQLFTYGIGLLMSAARPTVGAAARWTAAVCVFASAWPLLVDLGVVVGLLPRAAARAWEFSPYAALGTVAVKPNVAIPAAAPVLALVGALAFVVTCVAFDGFERRLGTADQRRRSVFGDRWGGSRRVPRWSVAALAWKDYRVLVGGREGILVRVVAYLVLAIAIAVWSPPWSGAGARATCAAALLSAVGIGVFVDLGMLASRVFRDEVRDGTYSSLLMLPKSSVQLATGKVGGCAAAAVPALPWLVLGVLLDPMSSIVTLGWSVLLVAFHGYLLIHLVVLASLYLARGAFALTALTYLLVVGGSTLLVETFQGIGAALALHGVLLILCPLVASRVRKRISTRLAELFW